MDYREECETKMYIKLKEVEEIYNKYRLNNYSLRMRIHNKGESLLISGFNENDDIWFCFDTNEECENVDCGYCGLYTFLKDGKCNADNDPKVKIEFELYNKAKEIWGIYSEYHPNHEYIGWYIEKSDDYTEYYFSNYEEYESSDYVSFLAETNIGTTLTNFPLHSYNLDDLERMVKEIG